MVTKQDEFTIINVKNPKGGDGELNKFSIISSEYVGKKIKKFVCITLEPHSSMGIHRHDGDCEGYYFTKGNATYIDDGKEVQVSAGDFTMVRSGHSHGVRNDSDTIVSFIALILEESQHDIRG